MSEGGNNAVADPLWLTEESPRVELVYNRRRYIIHENHDTEGAAINTYNHPVEVVVNYCFTSLFGTL